MDPKSYEAFSEAVLQEAVQCYGIADDNIRSIGSFDSFIYEYETAGQEYILRISHSLHRDADQIRGEVDWIDYLAQGGVSCSRAVPSQNGQLVEVIEAEESHFTAVAFEKARGRQISNLEMTPELFRSWGRLIGKIHHLSQDYQPANPAWKRLNWTQENKVVETFFPPSEATALTKFRETVAHVENLTVHPRDLWHDSRRCPCRQLLHS